MGTGGSKYLLPQHWRQDEPEAFAPIKYDAQFGFDRPRELKKATLSEAEMDSANFETQARDECSHKRIHYRGCIREQVPFFWRCKGFESELENCLLAERIHDMMEFEREKRLNARERRLRQSAASS